MKYTVKIYFLFVLLMIDISIIALSKVDFILIEYQNNVPETYISNTLKKLSSSKLTKYFTINNNYENKETSLKNIKKFLNSNKYQIIKKSNLVYAVKNNGKELLDIKLKTGKEKTELSMLTYRIINSCKIIKKENNSLYNYKIIAPSNYKIKINDIDINSSDLKKQTKISGLEDAYNYIDTPYINEYDINNLTSIPKIEITKNDEEKANIYSGKNIIDLSNDFKKYNTLEDAGVNYDVMNFATSWSLFSTNDSVGVAHGLYNVTPFFIYNSMMYKHAVNYAYSGTLDYINPHGLSNPIFQNNKISNVVKYSDNLVSVDVYVEKNLLLIGGQILVDPFNNTLYLGKYNNNWYVLGMKSIVKK